MAGRCPAGRVTAVEANRPVFGLLQRNLADNNVRNVSGHVKRSAVAGRSFMSFAGPEAHLDAWTREVADRREHALDLDRHRGVATRSQRKPPGAR